MRRTAGSESDEVNQQRQAFAAVTGWHMDVKLPRRGISEWIPFKTVLSTASRWTVPAGIFGSRALSAPVSGFCIRKGERQRSFSPAKQRKG